MFTQEQVKQSAVAAEVPQPAPTLSPIAAVEQLRAMRAQIGEVTPLTPEQRRTLLSRKRTPGHIVHASISVIGALDNVAQALGQPADEVRQMVEEADRWTTVEDELRAMLNGVAGANLVRRQRIEFLAVQAAVIGSRLALDPANAVLVPHVLEVKRLKRLNRRKKAVAAPETPQSPAPGTSGSTKT
jgi:hypothetical protein